MNSGPLILMAIAAVSSPTALHAAPRVLVPGDVVWTKVPQGNEAPCYYPCAPTFPPGKAVIDCLIQATGALTDCRPVTIDGENPERDLRALKLSRLFRAEPRTRSGQRTAGARVHIPIVFAMEPD